MRRGCVRRPDRRPRWLPHLPTQRRCRSSTGSLGFTCRSRGVATLERGEARFLGDARRRHRRRRRDGGRADRHGRRRRRRDPHGRADVVARRERQPDGAALLRPDRARRSTSATRPASSSSGPARCRPRSSSLDLSERADGVASAAGFVIDSEGRLLTNAHVVAGATDIRVTFSDEQTVPARVLGKDEETDLALLARRAQGPRPAAARARQLARRRGRRPDRLDRQPVRAATARSRPASCPPSSAGSRRRAASPSTT